MTYFPFIDRVLQGIENNIFNFKYEVNYSTIVTSYQIV